MNHPTPPRSLRLAVTGGGTGGHTYPALTTITALRDQLAAQGRVLDVTWYGSPAGLEARICAEQGISFQPVATGKVRRSLKPSALARTGLDMLRVPYGIGQATWHLARRRPDVVLSTGGFVAVPVGIGAALTRRPLVMHEQITSIGLANRLLARVATAVALSHASSRDFLPSHARGRITVTGNPVRAALLTGDPAAGRTAYHLDSDLPLIYVTGGAQGSAQINGLIAQTAGSLLERCQILHQTGPEHHHGALAHRANLYPHLAARYQPVPYVNDALPNVLAAANLVISRAGAGTLAELTALGKPAVLIPLEPTAADEQRRNAEHLAAQGAAIAITRPDVSADRLLRAVLSLLDDDGLRKDMADRSRVLGRPHAAQELAELILTHAKSSRKR